MQITDIKGSKVYRPENEQDLKTLRKMFPKTSKFIRKAQMQGGRDNPLNNRKATKGRDYKFIPIIRKIGSAMHAVREQLVNTGRFKKIFKPTKGL